MGLKIKLPNDVARCAGVGNAALDDADIVERLRESDNDTEYVSPIGNERRLTLAWEAAETIELLRLRLDHSDAQSEQLGEALVVVAAAKNLVAQKGRHNTEIAYKRLVDALTHNAEVSGAGTASAGLPGYTAGDNTE